MYGFGHCLHTRNHIQLSQVRISPFDANNYSLTGVWYIDRKMRMATHSAIVTVATGAPLELAKYPTVAPQGDEVLVKVTHTAAGPLDLHQAVGGLLVQHPLIMSDAVVGTVVKIGDRVKHFEVGDKVFGYCFAEARQRSWQSYATVPEDMVGKVCLSITKVSFRGNCSFY